MSVAIDSLSLTCCRCEVHYDRVTALVEHLLKTHQGRDFVHVECGRCDFKSSTARSMWVHHLRDKHSEDKTKHPLPCPVPYCMNKGKSFPNLRKLSIHYKYCLTCICKRCEIRFKSATDLQNHMTICRGQTMAHNTETRSLTARPCQPVTWAKTIPLLSQNALAIILAPVEYDKKAVELLASMQSKEQSEKDCTGRRDVREQPSVLDVRMPLKDPETSTWISCTTQELEEYLTLCNDEPHLWATIRIRDGDNSLQKRASDAFLCWINSGERFAGRFTGKSGVRKVQLLSPDGFLLRFSGRRGSHGASNPENCLSIQTSGRALHDVTILPDSLSLLDCDLLHSLENRILEQPDLRAEATIDPSLRTVLYGERGSFTPWRVDHIAGFWTQVIEGWSVFLRYIGPVNEETMTAILSNQGLDALREDYLQITYVGPGDVLIMRPEVSRFGVSQPVIYCSIVLEDTLAIQSPLWPSRPDKLLKILDRVSSVPTQTNDYNAVLQHQFPLDDSQRLQLYLRTLKDYIVERGEISSKSLRQEDAHANGFLSKLMHQALRRRSCDSKIRSGILKALDLVIAQQGPDISAQGMKNNRRSARLQRSTE